MVWKRVILPETKGFTLCLTSAILNTIPASSYTTVFKYFVVFKYLKIPSNYYIF